jgi:hypothetical protein
MEDREERTVKKNEKMEVRQIENEIRYFRFCFKGVFVEVIGTSFLCADVREEMTLHQALDTIVYSKIPSFEHNAKCNVEIILTLNPIVGLYE